MLIQQNKFYWISDRSMVAHLNYTDTKWGIGKRTVCTNTDAIPLSRTDCDIYETLKSSTVKFQSSFIPYWATFVHRKTVKVHNKYNTIQKKLKKTTRHTGLHRPNLTKQLKALYPLIARQPCKINIPLDSLSLGFRFKFLVMILYSIDFIH